MQKKFVGLWLGPYKIERNVRFNSVGRLVVVITVNPSHWFWTARLMKVFGHEGK